MVEVSYDPEADAIYVRFSEPEGRVRTKRIDDRRLVDYDENGSLVGVELLFVSQGVRLEDVPEADRIRDAMQSFPQPASA